MSIRVAAVFESHTCYYCCVVEVEPESLILLESGYILANEDEAKVVAKKSTKKEEAINKIISAMAKEYRAIKLSDTKAIRKALFTPEDSGPPMTEVDIQLLERGFDTVTLRFLTPASRRSIWTKGYAPDQVEPLAGGGFTVVTEEDMLRRLQLKSILRRDKRKRGKGRGRPRLNEVEQEISKIIRKEKITKAKEERLRLNPKNEPRIVGYRVKVWKDTWPPFKRLDIGRSVTLSIAEQVAQVWSSANFKTSVEKIISSIPSAKPVENLCHVPYEPLHCQFHGCTWLGDHLTTHLKSSHGMSFDEYRIAFKYVGPKISDRIKRGLSAAQEATARGREIIPGKFIVHVKGNETVIPYCVMSVDEGSVKLKRLTDKKEITMTRQEIVATMLPIGRWGIKMKQILSKGK